MKQLLLVIGIALCFPLENYGQTTDDTLHRVYWNYRERFKKYFTTIGPAAGQSLVCDRISGKIDAAVVRSDSFKLNSSRKRVKVAPNTFLPEYWGYKNFGDVALDFDQYIGVLATEYYLLKHYNHDAESLEAVKNELYFAINAIDRLDSVAEMYYKQSASKNGFFIRDDVPQDYMREARLYDDRAAQWHASNVTRGLMHIDTLMINDTIHYFGPDSFEMKQSASESDLSHKTNFWQDGTAAEMSQDHLYGVLMAFKFIQKFVDWDLEVDPDGPNPLLPKKNLVTWTAEITDRLMEHVSEQRSNIKWYDQENRDQKWIKNCRKDKCPSAEDDDPCDDCDQASEWQIDDFKPNNPTLANSANYVLVNPAKGNRHVTRGPYAFMFGYPIEKVGEELASANQPSTKDYDAVSVEFDDEERLMIVGADILSTVPHALGFIGAIIINPISPGSGLGTASYKLSAGLTNCGPLALLGPDGYCTCLIGRPVDADNPAFWRDMWNAIPDKAVLNDILSGEEADLANNMIIKMAAISGTWTHQKFTDYCDYHNYKYHDIMYGLLNESEPKKDKEYYQDILKNANKLGTIDETAHFPFNEGDIFSRPNKILTHAYNDQFPGNDYMLLYNMYRIADLKWWGTQNHITYKESSRTYPIANGENKLGETLIKHHTVLGYIDTVTGKSGYYWKQRSTLPYSTGSGTVNSVKTSIAYTGALKYGIRLPERISGSLTINNNGVLDVGYDLYFNGANLIVNAGGEVKTNKPQTGVLNHVIKIQSGSVLEIKADGKLTIDTNTTVIIEKGARLIYNPGAKVYLEGLTSVLEIQGVLEIKNGATFTPIYPHTNAPGFVRFDKSWDTAATDNYNVVGTGTGYNRFVIDGGGSTTAPKLLEVKGNVGINTDYALQDFKIRNGHIDMGEATTISSKAVNTEYYNLWLRGMWGPAQQYHNGIDLYGSNHKVQKVHIQHGYYGVTMLNIGTQSRMNLDSVKFSETTHPVRVWGGGVLYNYGKMEQFPSNAVYGVYARGCFGTSRIYGVTEYGRPDIYAGYSYMGTGRFLMLKNQIDNNTIGALVSDAAMELKCNTFTQNHRVSAELRGKGSLYASSGYNDFDGGNKNSAQTLLRLSGKPKLYLADGQNNFQSSRYSIQATLNTQTPVKLNAAYQPDNMLPGYDPHYLLLNAQNNYFWQTPVGRPLSSYNYWIALDSAPGFYHKLAGGPFSSVTSYNTTIQTSGCTLPSTYNETTTNVQLMPQQLWIPTDKKLYYDTTLHIWIDIFLARQKTTTLEPTTTPPNGYVVPLDSLGIILESTLGSSGNVNAKRESLVTAYNMMHEMLGNAILNHAVPVSSATMNSVVVRALDVQETLWDKSNDPTLFWKDYKYEILRDWAQIYRMAEHREDAVTKLTYAEGVLTDENDLAGIASWKCVNNAEIGYLEHPVSFEALVANNPCIADLDSHYEYIQTLPMPGDEEEPGDTADIIILYPNPTNGDLTVEIDDEETTESIQMVKINDNTATTLITQYGSGRTMNIDVSGLETGVYVVVITTDMREVMLVASVFH